MRYWIVGITCASSLVLLAACVALMSPDERPARSDGPQFDHAGHIDRGVECTDCHGDEDVGYNAMPDLDFCNECHEDIDGEADPEKRATVFFDENGNGSWIHVTALPKETIFDHKAHVDQKDGDCMACHADVAASKEILVGARIDMDECLACHRQEAPQALECASCHREIRRDRAPTNHRPGWIREHGRIARRGGLDPLPKQCGLCHEKWTCDTCHRAEQPRSHNNLWRLHGHAAAASIDRDQCAVCHTTDSCVLCHERTEPRNHRGAWGDPFNRHCVSCHLPNEGFSDQGCVVCHKSAPSHNLAPPRPGNSVHMTNDPAECRECHTPAPHPDNGQTCLLCHQ